MLTFDPKFIDASEWSVLPWFNSGGTRTKRVLQDEEGNLWYFKCSEHKSARDGKPEKYYKYEFWSEIIAYQLGKSMGLDILRYDAALHNDEVGCISPLMIDQDKEQLVEVGRYMTALNSQFNPDDRKTHNEYSFEFLIETLDIFNLSAYTGLFLKTIAFDALIGNTDRHQENWAFISRSTFYGQTAGRENTAIEKNVPLLLRWLNRVTGRIIADLGPINDQVRLVVQEVIKMAPIYDSGSSLGRELNHERIKTLMEQDEMLKQYIHNGKSELHWEKRKISHIEMIENLISSAYLEQLLDAAGFLDKFDEQNTHTLVFSLDKDVPDKYRHYCIPKSRKDFIIKLLTLRSEILKEIISNGRV